MAHYWPPFQTASNAKDAQARTMQGCPSVPPVMQSAGGAGLVVPDGLLTVAPRLWHFSARCMCPGTAQYHSSTPPPRAPCPTLFDGGYSVFEGMSLVFEGGSLVFVGGPWYLHRHIIWQPHAYLDCRVVVPKVRQKCVQAPPSPPRLLWPLTCLVTSLACAH